MNGDFLADEQAKPDLHFLVADTAVKDRRKDRLLRLKAVIARTGLSATTINRREAQGSFPKREQIGIRCVAWYESDIDDFVESPRLYRWR